MNPESVDHLYRDGKHYDLMLHGTQDLPFWTAQANRYGGPVLELACGTGRIAIPLAKEGFAVTGIDLSRAMLAEARDKAARESVSVGRNKTHTRLPGTGGEIVGELNMRMFFPQELEALLKYNGFRIDGKLGDSDERPFDAASPKQIVICSLRQ